MASLKWTVLYTKFSVGRAVSSCKACHAKPCNFLWPDLKQQHRILVWSWTIQGLDWELGNKSSRPDFTSDSLGKVNFTLWIFSYLSK